MWKANRWMTQLAGIMARGASALADARRHPRVETSFPVTLSGPLGTASVTCIEVSQGGAAVRTPAAVDPGALIFLRMPSLGLMGFAHVRHCKPENGSYRLGLEFRGALSRERDAGLDGFRRERLASQLAWDGHEL